MHLNRPELPKYVVIAAPHTSNWDFVLGMFGMKAIGLPLRWVGKHTIFKPGLRWFFEGVLGGIPVDRRSRHNVVDQIVELFEKNDEMVLVMTPEGTRSHTGYWKTGFYWIAHRARVPILLGFMDWGNREAGVGPMLWPTGDIEADFGEIREFYSGIIGKHGEKTGSVAIHPQPGTDHVEAGR